MPKLFTVGKTKDFQLRKRFNELSLYEKNLVDNNFDFLAMNGYEWDNFSKFVLRLDKDLKRTKNKTLLILSCALIIEGVIDLILIRMYGLDKYNKFSPFDFLKKINFSSKIQILRDLKKKYKKKQPKMEEKGYRSYATFSMEFFRKLKEKKWKNVGVLIKSIEDEINKEKGNNPIQSSSESIFAYTIKPGIPKAKLKYPDYLPDDIVGFIKKIDINDLEKIRDLRNCVSHSWNPENDIITNLHKWYPNSKTKKVELDMKVRKLCINTINSLIGLNLKS